MMYTNRPTPDFKIGFTCSTFDLLHAGHVLMLEYSRSHCDYLIAGLQIDPSVDRPEKNKPVQSYLERHIQLSAVRYVDRIIPYATETDLLVILRNLDFDYRFLGEEYKGKPFTGHDIPGHLDKCVFNPRLHNYSSSGLRRTIADAK